MSKHDSGSGDAIRQALSAQRAHAKGAAERDRREHLERRRGALLSWWESNPTGAARWIHIVPRRVCGKPPLDVHVPDDAGATRVFEAELIGPADPRFPEANRTVCEAEARVWDDWWRVTVALGDVREWMQVTPSNAVRPVSDIVAARGASVVAVERLGPELVRVVGSETGGAERFLAAVRRHPGGAILASALGLFVVGIGRVLGKYPFDIEQWRASAAREGRAPKPVRKPRQAILLAWDAFARARDAHPELARIEKEQGLGPAARHAHEKGWVGRFYENAKVPRRADTFGHYVVKGSRHAKRSGQSDLAARPVHSLKPGHIGPM